MSAKSVETLTKEFLTLNNIASEDFYRVKETVNTIKNQEYAALEKEREKQRKAEQEERKKKVEGFKPKIQKLLALKKHKSEIDKINKLFGLVHLEKEVELDVEYTKTLSTEFSFGGISHNLDSDGGDDTIQESIEDIVMNRLLGTNDGESEVQTTEKVTLKIKVEVDSKNQKYKNLKLTLLNKPFETEKLNRKIEVLLRATVRDWCDDKYDYLFPDYVESTNDIGSKQEQVVDTILEEVDGANGFYNELHSFTHSELGW